MKPMKLLPRPSFLALFLLAAPLVFAAVDQEKLKAELVKTEADFCAMAREKGIPAAFAHFIAPDGVLFDVDPQKHRGTDAVAKRYGDARPNGLLTWAPSFADVAESGDLGYTWGRYEYRGTGPDGQPRTATGYFLIIWKRQPDGTWRFVIDQGAPDRPKPPPPPKGNEPMKN
jgi:ketosteroid isomerase-like protein